MTRPLVLLKTEVSALMVAAGNTTPHFEGEELLRAHGAPPRCVWVSTVDKPSDVYKGGVNPPAIFAFDEQVEVHCWGQTRDAAYELRNEVLRAVRAAAAASVSVLPSGWLRPNRDTWAEEGHVYVLQLRLDQVPVPGKSAAEVTIESVEHTGDMAFPSGDQTGCSG